MTTWPMSKAQSRGQLSVNYIKVHYKIVVYIYYSYFAMSIAVAMVQSRLDYANSLLYNASACDINKLQRVQNMITRQVLGNRQIY